MTAPFSSRQARAAPPSSARPGSVPPRRTAPPLRVVGPVTRRHRARLATVLVSLAVLLSVFGLVASHVMLTQGQFRLDALRARTASEQERYERLRLQVAELESPSRIVAAAQERLGMVPPPSVTYLSPTGAASSTRDEHDENEEESAAEEDDYSRVKRSLASGQ